MSTIEQVFVNTRAGGRPALMPYLTAGYPDLKSLPAMVEQAGRSGADLLELGIPFSDPLADGPVLQRAGQMALERGFTLDGLFSALAEATRRGPPITLMTYINPVLARGMERFLDDAVQAGAAGVIVPDLPWIEAGPLNRLAKKRGLALIPLAAPTSTDEHLDAINRGGRGFVYGVSITGVTGLRQKLDPGVLPFAARLKQAVSLPVAMGFGIGTPDQAKAVGQAVDGVIVGSALVTALGERPQSAIQVIEEFVSAFREALAVSR